MLLMTYVLSGIVALMLVAGQLLWKLGIERTEGGLSSSLLMSREVFSFIFSPFILGGFAVYILATVLYMYLLGRYDYSVIQSLVIPLSLIFAYIVAGLFFKERILTINIIGVAIIVVGVILAVKR